MDYTPNYLCDLHCHTKRSDGNDEPWELIDTASRLGMKIIAITDHDIIPPLKIEKDGFETDIIEYGHKSGVAVIKGMEISCDTDVEDVHILAFGCTWDDAYFSELDSFSINSKIESYRQLVQVLIQHHIKISWDEILENQGNFLTPDKVQKKLIFEMIAKKGYAKNWQDAKLMVKDNPAFNIKRGKPDPLQVIDEIHRCGGIAILAHPYLIEEEITRLGKTMTREGYIERLIKGGIHGIEACYTYDKTSYRGKKTKEAIYNEVVSKYNKRLPILSGGSDYHADDKKGVKNARRIGECGLSLEYFYNNDLLMRLINH